MRFSDIITTQDQYEVAKARADLSINTHWLIRLWWASLLGRVQGGQA